MDMQAVYRQKVNRIRSWIARNTKDLVVRRSCCRVCKRIGAVGRLVSRDKLQSVICRPGALERRDAASFQLHPCGEEFRVQNAERISESQVWYDYSPQLGPIISSVPYRITGDAS